MPLPEWAVISRFLRVLAGISRWTSEVFEEGVMKYLVVGINQPSINE
jgi:hypothetical protein